MKKVFLLLSVAVLVLGLAFWAQASQTILIGGHGNEANLWDVINTLIPGAGATQANLQAATALNSIQAGSYEVTGYFKAAGFSQDFGFFNAGGSPTQGVNGLVQLGFNGYNNPVKYSLLTGDCRGFL